MKRSRPDKDGAQTRAERGFSLIELMMAMLVMAVGFGAITTLLATVIAINGRNNRDTTATLLAQKVIEQIASVNPATGNTQVNITDCQGNSWTISTTDAAGPSGAGANLVTSSSSAFYGAIDQTQSYSSIPTGYAMQYVDCTAANSIPTTYDVRWNIMTLRSGSTRLITAAARPITSTANQLGGKLFAVPVNLRSIGATP